MQAAPCKALTAGVVLEEGVASSAGGTHIRVVRVTLQHMRAAFNSSLSAVGSSRYRCRYSAAAALCQRMLRFASLKEPARYHKECFDEWCGC